MDRILGGSKSIAREEETGWLSGFFYPYISIVVKGSFVGIECSICYGMLASSLRESGESGQGNIED